MHEEVAKKKDPNFRDRVRSYGRWYLKPDSFANLYDRSVLREIDEDEELRGALAGKRKKGYKK